ncbi:MAG: protein-methionine-sulfoxide reductase catalytic subunit MsrP [Acidobacteriota bacterium]
MPVHVPEPWRIPEREGSPESTFQNRRELIRKFGGAGLVLALSPRQKAGAAKARIWTADLYPAARNAAFAIDEPLTPEAVASRHNVFDEFALERDKVWKEAASFASRPWRIHIGGAVDKQIQIDVDELIRKMGVEERLYRFRCVETWAMAVPWTGFPLKRLLDFAKPLAAAKYLRMVTAARPSEMPNWYGSRRVFPYYEALSLDEAANDLAFVATGIYGHPLPNQHGAPLRLIVPWKYGLKGIKSIVAFQLTRERPGTFWNELAPHHYSFTSNVDPAGIGQADETVLHTGEVRKTKPYNGYAEQVAHLYA